jgi:hypothetical protein
MTPAGFGRAHIAWTGPIRSRIQADREVTSGTDAGWAATRHESTPDVRAQVRAWGRQNQRGKT